jgi:hypothetical protein
MQPQTKHIPGHLMHKYVFGLLGVFLLIAVSYPMSFIRVSQDKKFANYNLHLKSLTMEYKPVKPSK